MWHYSIEYTTTNCNNINLCHNNTHTNNRYVRTRHINFQTKEITMSLDYDFTSIKDWEELHNNDWELTVSKAIVWTTMNVGFSGITEKNYHQFFTRSQFFYGLYGAPLFKGDEPYNYKLTDIKRRIGLRTNASTLTDPAFFKDLRRRYNLRINDNKYTEMRNQQEVTRLAELSELSLTKLDKDES